MFIFEKSKAFTLIELIIVIAVVSLIAAVSFVAINPVKRINDAKNAARDSNAKAIEKAIQNCIADNLSVPELLSSLSPLTNYMMVTEGGSTAGTAECATLDEAIARVNIVSAFKSHLGSMPVDEEATGVDTGYYIKRIGDNFFCGHCNAYGDTYVASVVSPCESELNAATGLTCDEVCANQGSCSCNNIGKADGVWSPDFREDTGGDCVWSPGSCDTPMVNVSAQCDGKAANWTWCECVDS